MKKIILFLAIVTFSITCSSDDDKKSIPEKFDIRIEVIGNYGSIPSASISINSSQKKQWQNVQLPFTGDFTYFTTGQEIENSSCECIRISSWAYISEINELQSFNLYVDGVLVDTETVVASPESNGIMNPTKVEFTFNP